MYYVYTYTHIYFLESSVAESERKKEKLERKKGEERKKRKFERVTNTVGSGFWKVLYLVGSFAFQVPSSTRSFASRLLIRRSLPLTRGYRFSELAIAVYRIDWSAFENLARIQLHETKNQKSLSILRYLHIAIRAFYKV